MWRTQSDLAGNCSKRNFLCRILCVSHQKCLLESNSTPRDVCCSWFTTGHNVHVDPDTQSKYSPLKWRSKIHLSHKKKKKISRWTMEREQASSVQSKASIALGRGFELGERNHLLKFSVFLLAIPTRVQTRWKLLSAISGRKLKEFYLVAFSPVHIGILCFHVGGDKVEVQIAAPFQVSLLKAQFSLSPCVCRC